MDSNSAKRTRFGATAGLYTIVVIAILGVVNYLGVRFNRPIDLTSNKRFTLSEETQKVVGNLKTDATITYFDKNFDQAKGILDRYKNLSSKIHVEYVNPGRDPIKAREYGLRFQGTAFVEEGNRREEAKSVDEQGITGAFLKISKGVRKVCFVAGANEHAIDQTDFPGLSFLKEKLERDNYQPEAVTLTDKKTVPADCKVTIVPGPKSDYPANEVAALKNYVETGGRVFFALDPPVDLRGGHVSENNELAGLLQSWGVTLDKDLVLEESPLGLQNLLIRKYEDHPICNDLKGGFALLPLVRSLEVKNEGKSTVTKLFSTSDEAVATTDLRGGKIKADKKGPFVLGAAGTYDTGKPNENGRFVVIGTSAFIANERISDGENLDLALNTVNWLSNDEDLISIRPKAPEDRKLDPTAVGKIQLFDFFLLPVFVIAGGILVFIKRR